MSLPAPVPRHDHASARRWWTALLLSGICLLLGASLVTAQGGSDPDDLFASPTPGAPLIGPTLLGGSSPDSAGVFVYDVNSGLRRDLSFGPGDHWFGSFAPDGCRFAFTMTDASGQNLRLYAARLDGSDVRALVDFSIGEGGDDPAAVLWEAWSPRWSPQGDRIAFILVRDYERGDERERTTHIAWVPPEGGPPTLYSVSGTEAEPVWRGDGEWLAYTSYELGEFDVREADIWIVSPDGGSKFQLTNFEEGSTLFPRWSPGGDVVAFAFAPSGNNHQFWTVPASGGQVQQWSYTWAMVLGFDWLPDGTGLVAAIKNWQGHDDNILWRIPLPGNADEEATVYIDDPAVTAADYPAFSPDGRFLAFRSAYSAMLYDTTTGELRLLDELGLNNSPLVWGPSDFAGELSCTANP